MSELYGIELFTDANLKSYYRLDDVNDSKNSYNLTNNGAVAFAAAKYGNGADLGSANSSKSLTNTDLLGLSSEADRTLVAWIKPVGNPGNNTRWDFISFGHATEKRAYYMGYSNINGSYYLHGGGFKDYIADYLVSYASGAISVWTLIALTFSGTTAELFVNAVSRGTVTIPTGNGNTGSTANNGLSIGRLSSSGGNYASGMVDDVAVFGKVLSASEQLALLLDNQYPACYLHARRDRMNMKAVSTQNSLAA